MANKESNKDFVILFNIPRNDADKIKDLFLGHNLNIDKVWSNYECLLRRHESATMVAFGGIKEERLITPSLKYFINPKRTPAEFPLWVYAAYPDVMAGYDLATDEQTFIREESLIEFLENLVSRYKSTINKELETR